MQQQGMVGVGDEDGDNDVVEVLVFYYHCGLYT